MLLGILSDTHDQLARTAVAVETLRNAGAQALIHCGDLTSAAIVAELATLPSWFVLGNCDAESAWELKDAAREFGCTCLDWSGTVELAGARIAVTHGHMAASLRDLRASKPNYLLTGHSHIPRDETVGIVRYINPGALHRAAAYTVVLLDLETGHARSLVIPR